MKHAILSILAAAVLISCGQGTPQKDMKSKETIEIKPTEIKETPSDSLTVNGRW